MHRWASDKYKDGDDKDSDTSSIGEELFPSSDEEDDQMVQNANAGSLSWDYQRDLPLHQNKKIIFGERYKQFFIKNYLVQFLTNKLPYVEQDAAVFDLQQGIADKAQKIMGNQ